MQRDLLRTIEKNAWDSSPPISQTASFTLQQMHSMYTLPQKKRWFLKVAFLSNIWQNLRDTGSGSVTQDQQEKCRIPGPVPYRNLPQKKFNFQKLVFLLEKSV